MSALRTVPAIAWAGLIFAVSSVPGNAIPGRFTVAGHFIEYAVLGALTLLAMPPGDARRRLTVAVLLSVLYGMTDELHQAFVPLRNPDVLDLLTDAAGAVAGAVACSLSLSRLRPARISPERPPTA